MNELYLTIRGAWNERYHDIRPPYAEADIRRVKRHEDFWKRNESRIRAVCARLSLDRPQTPSTEYAHLAPGDFAGIEEHLKDVLDLSPPSKPAREVLRPTWPATLAQLESMCSAGDVKQNPAPLLRSDKVVQSGVRGFSAGRALYHYQGPKPDSQADYNAVDGIAWRLSAPEGFPPIPRRGGVYSPYEAQAIDRWVERNWYVLKEVKAIGAAKDREILLQGIDPENIRRVLGDHPSITEWLNSRFINYQGTRALPSASEKSPKEYVQSILDWGRKLFPALAEVRRLDPRVFTRWPSGQEDAHVLALEGNDVTKYALRNVADYFYGLPRHTTDWSQWLGAQARSIHPNTCVLTPSNAGYTAKHWPLSELVHAKQQADDDYKSRSQTGEAAKRADIARALPVLREMLASGKQFNRANIERALPGYHFTEYKGTRYYSIGFRGPSPNASSLANGSAATISDAMAQIRKELGL